MGRAARAKAAVIQAEPAAPLKLDFGCGPHKRDGFQGVDATAFVGVDHVVDLKITPWPWADNAVAEAHCSHFLEHLTSPERVAFCNELYRVLAPGASCQLIVPHWGSCRAYGDPTHQWPPMGEFWFYYLSKEWRSGNAPHTDARFVPGMYACDFAATWGYTMRQDLTVRNQEYQQFAMQNYKEVIQDMVATLTAVK